MAGDMEYFKISALNRRLEEGLAVSRDELLDDRVVIDNILLGLNLGIHLRQRSRDEDAEFVFRLILKSYPEESLAHYELSLLLASQGKFGESTAHAIKCVRADGHNFSFVAAASLLLAYRGELEKGLRLVDGLRPVNRDDRVSVRALTQGLRYIARWTPERVIGALDEAHYSGRFLTTDEVARVLFSAVEQRRPFGMVRLGDGEGAWSFRSQSEESEFPDLFREMRRSFLFDWFQTDELLERDDFHNFAVAVSNDIKGCDILGVPERRRMLGEFGHLSRRGIPACVNLLRTFGLIDDGIGPQDGLTSAFCSANIHVDLDDTGFFQNLFAKQVSVGLITSYKNLPDILRARGANVVRSHSVPGDSRNLWKDGDGITERQYPDHYSRVQAELGDQDLTGEVYLVAAGFVGKRYVAQIKSRGGIAIDLGAVANRWAAAST